MKKIVVFLTLLLSTIFVANAQITTKNSSFGDNWFVSLNVGEASYYDHAFDWANHDWLGNYHKQIGAEIGKWVTPVTGFGLSYEAIGDINNSNTWADLGTVAANVHFNLNNFFCGYKGSPRTWEFEFVPSIGFVEYYGKVYPNKHSFYATGKAALSALYNFGKNKQWSIYVKPGVQYIDRFRHYNGLFDVQLGLTYKLKGLKSKSNNFVKCPYSVTSDEYNNAINTLKKEIKELSDKPKEVVKVVDHIFVESVDNTYNVYFDKGDSYVDDIQDIVDILNKSNSSITIIGSTSPEGSEEYNKNLALARANAVKEALIKAGIDPRRIAIISDYSYQRKATIVVNE